MVKPVHSVEMFVNDKAVAQLTRLLCSQDDDFRENNLAKEGDVVTDAEDPGIRVTNGHIDVDTGGMKKPGGSP